VKNTSKKFHVVSVRREMIFNNAEFYKPLFKKVVVNGRPIGKKKLNFQSDYWSRPIPNSKEYMRVIRCSVNNCVTVYSDFPFQKTVEL